MLKLLVAVKSCLRDRELGAHDVIHNTWGRDVGSADLGFFVGHKDPLLIVPSHPYEVYLTVGDDYDSLSFKTREILRWSLGHNYDFTFLCDTDTFIIPYRLRCCGFEQYDIAARFGTAHPVGGPKFDYVDGRGFQGRVHPWPSGGLGYFVSRKAAEIIVATEPVWWAEDMYVGQALGPYLQSGKLEGLDIPDYECNISWHWPRRATGRAYEPSSGWMERMQDLYGSTK